MIHSSAHFCHVTHHAGYSSGFSGTGGIPVGLGAPDVKVKKPPLGKWPPLGSGRTPLEMAPVGTGRVVVCPVPVP